MTVSTRTCPSTGSLARWGAGLGADDLADHVAACPACREAAQALEDELEDGPDATPWWELVPRLRHEQVLGRGGQGLVVRAHDEVLGRDVAVKLVASRPTGVAEARALAQPRHPHLIEVYDAFAVGDYVALVLELADGGDLQQWLLDRQRERAAIVDRFAQAGRGLVALHELGLAHGDVKPSNILLTGDGRMVKLADLGALAGHARDAPVGTPKYAAPERLLGGPPDAASDQYSWALCVFEAVYRLPVTEVAQLRRRPFDPLARVLGRALEPDPRRRWPSMNEVLDRVEGDGRSMRAGRGPFALAVLGLLAALVLLVIALGSTDAAPRVADRVPRGRRPTARAEAPVAARLDLVGLHHAWRSSGIGDGVADGFETAAWSSLLAGDPGRAGEALSSLLLASAASGQHARVPGLETRVRGLSTHPDLPAVVLGRIALRRAKVAFNAGRFDQARTLLNQAMVHADPASWTLADSRRLAAMLHLELGDPDLAIVELQPLLAEHPHQDIAGSLGVALTFVDRPAAAERAFARASDLARQREDWGSHVDYGSRRAFTLAGQGRSTAATAAIDEAFARAEPHIDPDSIAWLTPLVMRAQVAASAGDLVKAQSAADRSAALAEAALGPTNRFSLSLLTLRCWMHGQVDFDRGRDLCAQAQARARNAGDDNAVQQARQTLEQLRRPQPS